jgi:hypothetical protein
MLMQIAMSGILKGVCFLPFRGQLAEALSLLRSQSKMLMLIPTRD